jgi:hypothetical protein
VAIPKKNPIIGPKNQPTIYIGNQAKDKEIPNEIRLILKKPNTILRANINEIITL